MKPKKKFHKMISTFFNCCFLRGIKFALKQENPIFMFLSIKFNRDRANKLKTISDEELINTFKKTEDNRYIGELFERYTHLIFGVCMKYLKDEENSKDAVMDIFEELGGKLKAHDISNFKSWIYSVSKNHCLMILRKETRKIHEHQNMYEIIRQEIMESGDIFHPSDNNELEDKIKKLKTGIIKLKEEQRTCIELLYLQNKSYQEVAELTGYNLKKVKSYIQNGKRNLKIFLED